MHKKSSWRSSTIVIHINDGSPPLAISAKPSVHTCSDAKIKSKAKRIHGSSNSGVGYTQQQKRRGPKRHLNKSVKEEDDIPLAMLAYQKGIMLNNFHRHSFPSCSTSSSLSSSKPINGLPRKRNQTGDKRPGRTQHHHRHSTPSNMQRNSYHKIKKLHPNEHRSITSETPSNKTHRSRLNEKLTCAPEIPVISALPTTTASPKPPTCLSCFKFEHWSNSLIKKMFQKKSKTASVRSK